MKKKLPRLPVYQKGGTSVFITCISTTESLANDCFLFFNHLTTMI
jgi:hypothetical protein